MKNMFKKIMTLVLVAAMSTTFIAAAPVSMAQAVKEDSETTVINSGDMTAYVMTDASDEPQKILLSDVLANALPDGKSKGLAMYDSDGNKIDKPSIEKDLPVEMSISYTLDGKKISPNKLSGKSGHLVIRYDYKNLCTTEAQIAGKTEKIFVPFAVMTGLVLDNTVAKNINVTSGKVVSDGSRSIVAGIALPGMQENLKLDKEIIELPEYVEISADVENFQLAMSLSMVTNDIFSDNEDLSIDTSDVEASVKKLREAMNMLIDGSSKLYDGISLLSDKSGELVGGVTQLTEGMQQLDANSAALNNGATQVFNSLLSMANQQIADKGLEITQLTIENYKDVLTQLIDSLCPEAVTETIKNKVIEELQPMRPEFRKTAELIVAKRLREEGRKIELDRIAAEVEAQQGEQVHADAEKLVRAEVVIESAAVVTERITAELRQNAIEHFGYEGDYDSLGDKERIAVDLMVGKDLMNPANQQRIKDETDADVETRMASQEVIDIIEAKAQDVLQIAIGKEIALQAENTEKAANAYSEEHIKSPENQEIIEQHADALMEEAVSKALNNELINNAILQQAEEAVKQLTELLISLNSYSAFHAGVYAYTNGVSTARAGCETLYAAMPDLVSGITQLKDGSKTLYDGLCTFDKEGISRIVNALDGDLGELKDRLEASFDAAKAYKGVSTLPDGSCVSYVYRSDSIQ